MKGAKKWGMKGMTNKLKRVTKSLVSAVRQTLKDFTDPERIKVRQESLKAHKQNQRMFYDYMGIFPEKNMEKVRKMEEEKSFKERVEEYPQQETEEEYLEVDEEPISPWSAFGHSSLLGEV